MGRDVSSFTLNAEYSFIKIEALNFIFQWTQVDINYTHSGFGSIGACERVCRYTYSCVP